MPLSDVYSYSYGDGECGWMLGAIGIEAVACLEEVVYTGLCIEADDERQTVFQSDA